MKEEGKFDGLTLMQCGKPENGQECAVLVYSSYEKRFSWRTDTWSNVVGGGWKIHKNVIAWFPLPPIPTEQELESLYKAPTPNDE